MNAKRIKLLYPALALAFSANFSQSWAHDEDGASRSGKPEQLGEVSFPVSCNDAAQKEFNRAMALFHSFWFAPAKQSFGKVLEHDPECGIAHWGIAFMSMGNPFTWPTNPNVAKAGAPAMAEAQRVGAKTERERDYIAALSAFFRIGRRPNFARARSLWKKGWKISRRNIRVTMKRRFFTRWC